MIVRYSPHSSVGLAVFLAVSETDQALLNCSTGHYGRDRRLPRRRLVLRSTGHEYRRVARDACDDRTDRSPRMAFVVDICVRQHRRPPAS